MWYSELVYWIFWADAVGAWQECSRQVIWNMGQVSTPSTLASIDPCTNLHGLSRASCSAYRPTHSRTPTHRAWSCSCGPLLMNPSSMSPGKQLQSETSRYILVQNGQICHIRSSNYKFKPSSKEHLVLSHTMPRSACGLFDSWPTMLHRVLRREEQMQKHVVRQLLNVGSS